jgi:hypothetical protein
MRRERKERSERRGIGLDLATDAVEGPALAVVVDQETADLAPCDHDARTRHGTSLASHAVEEGSFVRTLRDSCIDRLASLFRLHPAWREAARTIDPRSTSNVFFTHRPGEPWHLERRGDATLLLPGAVPDPDFAFRFSPGAVARLESVRGESNDFAAELFALALDDDPAVRVDVRVVAGFPRLLRRGYVRLLLESGSRVREIGAAHGVRGLNGLRRLVAAYRNSTPRDWEDGAAAG